MANAKEEIFKDGSSARGVDNFRMELNPVEAAAGISHGSYG